MKLKIIVGVSIFAFFTFIVSLSVAGLVLYEKSDSPQSKASLGMGNAVSELVAENGETISSLTLENVGKHNSSDDCWSVIDGKVYSITEYLVFHPGGTETIVDSCGIDSSVMFHSKGDEGRDHLPTTNILLQAYYLGDLGAEIRVQNGNGGNVVLGGGSLASSNTPNSFGVPGDSNNGSNTSPIADSVVSNSGLTSSVVASHNTTGDCWGIIGRNVYDLTSYVSFHPGGTNPITSICGGDMTQAFNTKGGGGSPHSSYAQSLLGNYYIGIWGSTTTPSGNIAVNPGGIVPTSLPASYQTNTPPTLASAGSASVVSTSVPVSTNTTLTNADVAVHNSEGDCWIIYNSSVYNITSYIPFHPGGTNIIVLECGGDATNAFDSKGSKGKPHSSGAINILRDYFIGNIGGTVTNPTDPSAGTTLGSVGDSGNETSPNSSTSSAEDVILAVYPGANIVKVNVEDDGRKEVKFKWNGQEYTAKLDVNNNITKVEGGDEDD